jgi:hypothetical protein
MVKIKILGIDAKEIALMKPLDAYLKAIELCTKDLDFLRAESIKEDKRVGAKEELVCLMKLIDFAYNQSKDKEPDISFIYAVESRIRNRLKELEHSVECKGKGE